VESDFGERYYQEVCAKVSARERQLQAAQFLLSSGALVTLLTGVSPIWKQLAAFAAAAISGILLTQKLSRSSSTAVQLQDGWSDLHRQLELLWARLENMREEDVLAHWEKLSLEAKTLNSKATQTFPASQFNKLRLACWEATLRERTTATI
jgi:hypothetical protein